MSKTIPKQNKALVLEAFDTLFNRRDYNAAERFWSGPVLHGRASSLTEVQMTPSEPPSVAITL